MHRHRWKHRVIEIESNGSWILKCGKCDYVYEQKQLAPLPKGS